MKNTITKRYLSRCSLVTLLAAGVGGGLAAQSPKLKPPPQQVQQDTKAPAASQYGAWTLVGSTTHPMTDEKITEFRLSSQDKQQAENFLVAPMSMTVRLIGADLTLYISTDFAVVPNRLGIGVECDFRFDRGKVRQELCAFDPSHILFFNKNAEKALRELSSSKSFAIGIPSSADKMQYAIFQMNGTANVWAHIEAEINKARHERASTSIL
ncbi:MAG: hypothetical protein LBB40_06110 [Holophagales bacterium]|jgi:hypothetical protein|nr:hypothetical protein [Holophagales bacterium]